MTQYAVTNNFIFDGKSYNQGTEIKMATKKARDINAKGQDSHPELSPFLVPVNETEAVE
ncbi:hypothetical protein AB3331_04600 [Streptococcus sp. H49]|uniref:hypothetical protein n=1 Tax=Streptococcus huangxiaojuni TaxID=3237239 RepID=UPI0034A4F0A7